jgi:hypothetical protein
VSFDEDYRSKATESGGGCMIEIGMESVGGVKAQSYLNYLPRLFRGGGAESRNALFQKLRIAISIKT